ncbi:MAG: glycosyltransferase family 1 protein [Caulobacteraceae bacterium]
MTTSALAGLRVCIDARQRPVAGRTGVATYSELLAETLGGLGAQVEYLTDVTPPSPAGAKRIRRWIAAARPGERQLSPDGRGQAAAWSALDLFREAQVYFNLHGRLLPVRHPDPPAVMHWTYPLPMTMAGTRNIYTVHDAIPWERPDLTGISRSRHLRLLEQVRQAADLIVTVSDHSREVLLRLLGCPPGLIVNTYQAVHAQTPAALEATLPAGLSCGRYFLFHGSVEPRKNLARLVAAHRTSGVDLPLVIAGPDGWMAKRAVSEEALAGGNLIRLPWLERPMLTALVANARAVLFPSLAEGFGLPVLEAMALGAPAMTANTGALVEIAGDGALTVDPEDVEAMAGAIVALSRDEQLLARLRQAGFTRAATFSREAYAGRLARTYADLLQTPLAPRPG